MSDSISCPVCNEAIGVYEPVIVIGEGLARTTSLAREPLLRRSGDTVVHRACAPRAEPAAGNAAPES